MIRNFEKGDKAIVKTDIRHPAGTVVIVKEISKTQDKPYYCQTEGGFVCGFYGDEDLEKVNE